jgi:hypothetical protein
LLASLTRAAAAVASTLSVGNFHMAALMLVVVVCMHFVALGRSVVVVERDG